MAKSKEVAKITLGLAISWILGVMFGLSGLVFTLKGSMGAGIPLIIASLVLLPPITQFIKTKFNFELSRGLKIVLVIILFIIYAVNLTPSDIASVTNVEVQPTQEAQKEEVVEPVIKKETQEPAVETITKKDTQESEVSKEAPIPEAKPSQKVKSATIQIDRVQIQLANLYPTRVTVTNTGDVSINPKFDIYIYDNNGKEVCSGSPMVDEFSNIPSEDKKTGELTMLGCMFKEDGSYTFKIDLLDSDYNKLDTKTKEFTVDYWADFEI